MEVPGRRNIPRPRWSTLPWTEATSLLILAVAVAIPLARMFGTGATSMEEANALVVGAGILEGRLPHADVEYLLSLIHI